VPSEILDRVKCVFFIPTKARVYRSSLPHALGSEIITPPAGLKALADYFQNGSADAISTKVVDLTPALETAAQKLLEHGEFVFWRDDTHWNHHGTKAVASVVRDCLQQ
jgi:hypothetical protein